MATRNKSDFDLAAYLEKCAWMYAYLTQDKVWFPNRKPKVRIADMDETWRYNSAQLMVRSAAAMQQRYAFGEIHVLSRPMQGVITEIEGVAIEGGPAFSHLDLMSDHLQDAFDREGRWAAENPEKWIRTTELYKALVAGLPTTPRKLANLAERSRHWSACPARLRMKAGCTCPTGNPEMCRACYAAGEQCINCGAADGATWD